MATKLVRSDGGPLVVQFEHLARAGARHAVSTRVGGVSRPPFAEANLSRSVGDDPERVAANRAALCRAVGADPAHLHVPGLVHGNRVRRVGPPLPAREGWGEGGAPAAPARPSCDSGAGLGTWYSVLGPSPDPLDGFDALMAVTPGTAMLVTCADCVPVLVFDPATGAAGVAHAGWRGTLLDVAGALVRAMVAESGSDPGRLLAAVGPGIGPCCYEVGPDVWRPAQARFAGGVVIERRGSVFFDLPRANVTSLLAAGLAEANVAVSRDCTACRTDLYFSHRAERGRTGRFGAVILAGRSEA